MVSLPSILPANFYLYWLAQATSKFGDPITLIALAALAYRVTGSALVTTLAVMVATVPQATIGFFGGSIADALGLRRSMIWCDFLRAVLIAMIPIALALGASLAVVFGLALGAALCASVFNPARVAIVPSLVPPERLAASNSLVYASDRIVEILGAVIGGLLVASIGDAAFYIDALTFAFSGALLLFVRSPEQLSRPRFSARRIVANTAEGVQFLRRHRLLRANTLFSLLAQLSVGVANGLLPVLIFRRFANADAQFGAQLFGVAEAAMATGAVAMGFAYAKVARRQRKGRLLIVGWLGYGASLVAIAFAPSFEVLLTTLVAAGVLNVMFFVPNVTISQELTPSGMRGRVFGARMSLLSLSWLPIVLFAGGLADVVDVAVLIGAAGAFTVLVALVASRVPAVADVP